MFIHAVPNSGIVIKFLGWSPKGNEFAYVQTWSESGKNTVFVKWVRRDGRILNKTLKRGVSIRTYLKKTGFWVSPLPRSPAGDRKWRFELTNKEYRCFKDVDLDEYSPAQAAKDVEAMLRIAEITRALGPPPGAN